MCGHGEGLVVRAPMHRGDRRVRTRRPARRPRVMLIGAALLVWRGTSVNWDETTLKDPRDSAAQDGRDVHLSGRRRAGLGPTWPEAGEEECRRGDKDDGKSSHRRSARARCAAGPTRRLWRPDRMSFRSRHGIVDGGGALTPEVVWARRDVNAAWLDHTRCSGVA